MTILSGLESCTIEDIKNYKPKSNSISNSQVLFEDYSYEKAKLVLKEMVELLCLQLVEKRCVTDLIHLYIGYSKDVIVATGGSRKLFNQTNQCSVLLEEFVRLYEKTTNVNVPVRRIGVSLGRLQEEGVIQMDLFSNEKKIEKENRIQNTVIDIKSKFGKNAVLKGINLEEGATTRTRNNLIGGHNGY